jgi:ABC-type lipoprotein release transport system permease subunit
MRFRFLEQNSGAFESLAADDVMVRVASYLFGVSITYVKVYLAVILLLSLIAIIATLGPALRATRVDLTTVLRQ